MPTAPPACLAFPPLPLEVVGALVLDGAAEEDVVTVVETLVEVAVDVDVELGLALELELSDRKGGQLCCHPFPCRERSLPVKAATAGAVVVADESMLATLDAMLERVEEDAVGIGTGTGVLVVDGVRVLALLGAAEEAAFALLDVGEEVGAADEAALLDAVEIALTISVWVVDTDVVTVDMVLGMGTGTGAMTGKDVTEALVLEPWEDGVAAKQYKPTVQPMEIAYLIYLEKQPRRNC